MELFNFNALHFYLSDYIGYIFFQERNYFRYLNEEIKICINLPLGSCLEKQDCHHSRTLLFSTLFQSMKHVQTMRPRLSYTRNDKENPKLAQIKTLITKQPLTFEQKIAYNNQNREVIDFRREIFPLIFC